jgi:hypothetical protein
MIIHRVRALFTASIALFATLGAHAAAATYTLSCEAPTQGLGMGSTQKLQGTQSTLELPLTSFSFQINAPASGRRPVYVVSIRFLSTKIYSELEGYVTRNENIKSCRLIETAGGAGVSGRQTPISMGSATGKVSTAGAIYEWTFTNGTFTSLTAIGSDGSNTNSSGEGVPTGFMQATLEFQEFSFASKP